jgi:hypothetical protein
MTDKNYQYKQDWKYKDRNRKRLLELKKLHKQRREIVKKEGKILDQIKE